MTDRVALFNLRARAEEAERKSDRLTTDLTQARADIAVYQDDAAQKRRFIYWQVAKIDRQHEALADAQATVAAQAAVIERVKALAAEYDHPQRIWPVEAGFSRIIRAALAGPDGGEATAEPETPKPCQGFAWIGQSWAHCDRCSLPFWEHTHDEFREVLTPITPERAEASRQKWGE